MSPLPPEREVRGELNENFPKERCWKCFIFCCGRVRSCILPLSGAVYSTIYTPDKTDSQTDIIMLNYSESVSHTDTEQCSVSSGLSGWSWNLTHKNSKLSQRVQIYNIYIMSEQNSQRKWSFYLISADCFSSNKDKTSSELISEMIRE